MRPLENWLKKIGYGYFAVFLLLCVYYFKERVIYIDSANQIFEMINKESFEIFVGRYSMAISQLLPLLAIKLHLSLRAILIIYSISFGLVYLGAYYLCAEKLKNIPAALVIAISFVSASHTFFHALSETLQLIAFGALLFAWLSKLKQEGGLAKLSLVKVIVTLFLLLLNFFIHPVALFSVLFVFLYVFADELKRLDKRIIGLTAFWFMLFVVKALFFSKGSHDESFLGELKNVGGLIPKLGSLYPVHFLKIRFLQFYFIPFLMLLAVLWNWFRQKNWGMIFGFLLFIGGFLLISLVIYNKGDANHGMERSFLPLLFFIALPFFNEVFRKFYDETTGKQWLTIPAIIVLLSVGIANILIAAPKFERRTKELQGYIDLVRCSSATKFFIKKNTVNPDLLMVNYGTAIETILLSSLDNPLYSRTIFLDDTVIASLPEKANSEQIYFTQYWPLRNIQEFNSRYYTLYGSYHELTLGRSIPTENWFFNLETKNPEGTHYLDSLLQHFAANAELSDSSQALSGRYAVKVDSAHPFALECRPLVKPNHRIKISINKKGFADAVLVLTDDHGYYKKVNTGVETNGWQKLMLSEVIPTSVSVGTLKVYVWNPGAEPAYFDDLTLQF